MFQALAAEVSRTSSHAWDEGKVADRTPGTEPVPLNNALAVTVGRWGR